MGPSQGHGVLAEVMLSIPPPTHPQCAPVRPLSCPGSPPRKPPLLMYPAFCAMPRAWALHERDRESCLFCFSSSSLKQEQHHRSCGELSELRIMVKHKLLRIRT